MVRVLATACRGTNQIASTQIAMLLEHDPISGRYILRIDASAYKESDCLEYVRLKIIEGYTPPTGDGNNPMKLGVLEYGTAFHKGLQLRAQGAPFSDQLQAVTTHYSQPDIYIPDSDFRKIGHLANCYFQYDQFWTKEGDLIIPIKHGDKALAEYRFMYPFYRTDKVEVLLCGTIDLIATYVGQPVIVDHKTTAAWDSRSYLDEYYLSPQLMTYKWVYDKLTGGDVGCVVNGIFLAKDNRNKFKRSDLIQFSDWQVSQHMNHMTSRVVQIVGLIEYNLTHDIIDWPRNYCCCVKRYGEKSSPCAFTNVCRAANPRDAQTILDSGFERKMYNPMTHQT